MHDDPLTLLERYIGRVDCGWPSKDEPSFSIVRVLDRPSRGIDTYSSLGISHHQLTQKKSRALGQELFCSLERTAPSSSVIDIIGRVGRLMLDRHAALPRGEVIQARAILASFCDKTALYAASPAIFDGLPSASDELVFVWLIPITEDEALFTKNSGWSTFEDHLDRSRVNVFDPRRPSSLAKRLSE